MSRVDLYQIHWPFPPVPIESWMEALAEGVHRGWTQAVGVSNYNPEQTQRIQQTEQIQHPAGIEPG
jgi:diketogulonate reductase-like aldo/keto reductase